MASPCKIPTPIVLTMYFKLPWALTRDSCPSSIVLFLSQGVSGCPMPGYVQCTCTCIYIYTVPVLYVSYHPSSLPSRSTESVRLIECDLANQTPFVKNIQFLDPPSSSVHGAMDDYSFSDPNCTTRKTIIANLDVGIRAPDSRLVVRARLGGKR